MNFGQLSMPSLKHIAKRMGIRVTTGKVHRKPKTRAQILKNVRRRICQRRPVRVRRTVRRRRPRFGSGSGLQNWNYSTMRYAKHPDWNTWGKPQEAPRLWSKFSAPQTPNDLGWASPVDELNAWTSS